MLKEKKDIKINVLSTVIFNLISFIITLCGIITSIIAFNNFNSREDLLLIAISISLCGLSIVEIALSAISLLCWGSLIIYLKKEKENIYSIFNLLNNSFKKDKDFIITNIIQLILTLIILLLIVLTFII